MSYSGPVRIRRVFLLCALMCATAVFAQSAPLEDLATFPKAKLTIQRPGNEPVAREFDVWVADNPDRQEQGLMFVRSLLPGQGMVFPERPPRVMTMWMKNTFVELDMVFVGTDNRIAKILARAHPQDETNLSSEVAVVAVLEIGGGEAARLNLRPGDRVRWTLSK